LDSLAWPGLVAVIVLLLCAFILSVLWLLVPIILLKTNSKLNALIAAAEKTNQLLKQRSKKATAPRSTAPPKKRGPQVAEKKEPVVTLSDI
jgi:hypothetical protein